MINTTVSIFCAATFDNAVFRQVMAVHSIVLKFPKNLVTICIVRALSSRKLPPALSVAGSFLEE